MSGTDGEWEYETLRPPRGATKKEAVDPKAQLNELGGNGWELVTTVEYVGGGTKYMVFKRPADADGATDADDGSTDTDTEADDDAAVGGDDTEGTDDTDTDDAVRSDAATGEGDQ